MEYTTQTMRNQCFQNTTIEAFATSTTWVSVENLVIHKAIDCTWDNSSITKIVNWKKKAAKKTKEWCDLQSPSFLSKKTIHGITKGLRNSKKTDFSTNELRIPRQKQWDLYQKNDVWTGLNNKNSSFHERDSRWFSTSCKVCRKKTKNICKTSFSWNQ